VAPTDSDVNVELRRKRVSHKQPKLGQRVAQRILDAICDKGMVAGDMLPSEPKLMDHYQVGRGTLREALRVLEAHGIITVRPGPGGGPMVSAADGPVDLANTMKLHLQLRGATYEEIADGRLAIEPFLARLAAERQDPAGLQALRGVMAEFDDVDLDDADAVTALSWRFHRAIGAMSGNRVVDLLGSALIEVHKSGDRREAPFTSPQRAATRRRFQQIADAIFAGDAAQAEYYASLAMRYYARQFLPKHPDVAKAAIRWH